MNKYNIDLNAVLIKPLYIGLLINIFIPVIIVGVAYYIEESGGLAVSANENLDLLFWVLIGIAVIDGAAAIILKQKMFFRPFIASKETFEQDFGRAFFTNSLIGNAITAAIAIYGLVFYLLGGTFNQLIFFVFISFIAFQLIRPRIRFSKKVLAVQEKYVDEGHFLIAKN